MSDPYVVAQQAAWQAGQVLLRHWHRHPPAVTARSSYDITTEADLEAERVIVECIRRAFPEHAILSEETQRTFSLGNDLWVIDPLDGTNNFVHGLPQFSVSLAYYSHRQPTLGIVYQPATGDWFVARHGQGAWHNGWPMRVTAHTQLQQVLVGVGFYYDRGTIMRATLAAIADLFDRHIQGIRRFGSAALDLCMVGNGNLGAFFELDLSPWDYAAGKLIVEEAGGLVTTCRGEPLGLERTSVLAASCALHREVLEVLRPHTGHRSQV